MTKLIQSYNNMKVSNDFESSNLSRIDSSREIELRVKPVVKSVKRLDLTKVKKKQTVTSSKAPNNSVNYARDLLKTSPMQSQRSPKLSKFREPKETHLRKQMSVKSYTDD